MNRPGSVVHIITRMIRGGAQTLVLALAEGLRTRGWHCTILTGPADGPEGSLLEDAARRGLPIEVVPTLGREVRPAGDLRALGRLFRMLDRLRPDVVHTHTSKAGLLGRLAARGAGIKAIVHSPHGHIFDPEANIPGVTGHPGARRAFYWLERGASRLAHRMVLLSESERSDLRALRVLPPGPNRCRVVPNAVEPRVFEEPTRDPGDIRLELGLPPHDPVVGIVGRLASEKGHATLLDAFQLLHARRPGARLLIVGDGPERHALLDRCRAAGLRDHVVFTGIRQDVPDMLAVLDVFVVASHYEGFGLVALEAMAAGRPVVAAVSGGIPEVVRDGETGLLVPRADAPALAAALETLLADPGRAAAMGRRGREIVRDRFSMPRMLDDIEGLYRELLA